MNPIQMVDLQAQHLKIKDEITAAIQHVIQSGQYIKGPQVAVFNKNLAEYLDVEHVISCANGTDALQIAMMALNLKHGDEVIIPAFTYVATAEVIALLGLTPVLVDVDADTFLINVSQIEAVITPKTKAIVPVHLFGQCADMDAIMQLANKYNLYVIEDTAQAIGAKYSKSDGSIISAGTIGHIGCTSFFPSKNLGCLGDGGAMFTRDEQLAKRLQMIANHGQSVQYQHDEVGVNSRLDTIQAAILNIKLKTLTACEQARNKVAAAYDEAFAQSEFLTIPTRVKNSTHVFHQYTLKCNGINRDDLKRYLAEKKIPSMVYYPIPLHKQKAYLSSKIVTGGLPVTENLCSCVISLPISPEITDEQLAYIITNVNEFFAKN
jgi:UDP-2-acetamido-2-deoxy-ribo-hexuluronate aminotransferase